MNTPQSNKKKRNRIGVHNDCTSITNNEVLNVQDATKFVLVCIISFYLLTQACTFI